MDYLSVKEIAELWGVSIRMVNYYLNTGRIQGAIRKSGGWLIPANTPHPADLRKSGQRGQEKIPPRMAKCYMPLISRPCDNGFQNLLLTMNDEEERDIARALHHYFRDEHEEAREISEKYLTSKCPEIRLSALITNTMAMLQTGDAAKCRRNLEMIQRDGQRANDDSWRLYSSITDALISVFFHSEKLDLTPIRPAIGILPPGMQYFAMYAIAHALYIRREYEHAMGIAESALLMAGTRYPIDSIYLNIVLCMISSSAWKPARHSSLCTTFRGQGWITQPANRPISGASESSMVLTAICSGISAGGVPSICTPDHSHSAQMAMVAYRPPQSRFRILDWLMSPRREKSIIAMAKTLRAIFAVYNSFMLIVEAVDKQSRQISLKRANSPFL